MKIQRTKTKHIFYMRWYISWYISWVFLLWAQMSAQAADTSCEVFCSKYDLVNVQFYAQELTDHFDTAMTLKTSYRTHNDLPKLSFAIHSVEEITTHLKQLARECKRVKVLRIDAHGEPGVLILDAEHRDQDLNRQALLTKDIFPECSLAKDIQIDSIACNLGKGCQGQAFLTTMAEKVFSKKGGQMSANTDFGLTILGLPVFSMNLNRQTLSIKNGASRSLGASQKTLQWDDQDTNMNSCRDELQGSLKTVKNLYQTIKTKCSLSSEEWLKLEQDFKNFKKEYQAWSQRIPEGQRYRLGQAQQDDLDLFELIHSHSHQILSIQDQKFSKKHYPSLECQEGFFITTPKAYRPEDSFLRNKQ